MENLVSDFWKAWDVYGGSEFASLHPRIYIPGSGSLGVACPVSRLFPFGAGFESSCIYNTARITFEPGSHVSSRMAVIG